MQLKTYNGENFQRNKLRYLIFAIIFSITIILSLIKDNFVGVVILCLLLGAYFYYSVISKQIIKIKIEKAQLIIGEKKMFWNNFIGYALEIDPKTKEIKNIVFVTHKSHFIYTIKDTTENLKTFLEELEQYISPLNSYQQSFLEKMGRVLKL